MISEWMRVMLEEIARKKQEASDARVEFDRRAGEGRLPEPPEAAGAGAAGGSPTARGSHSPADG